MSDANQKLWAPCVEDEEEPPPAILPENDDEESLPDDPRVPLDDWPLVDEIGGCDPR